MDTRQSDLRIFAEAQRPRRNDTATAVVEFGAITLFLVLGIANLLV